MSRRYARAFRGARALGFVPKNWGESTTLIAGIGLRGVVAPMVLPGSLDGPAFEAYIKEFVLDDLRQGDLIVLDNLQVHKRESVKLLIEKKGARIIFIPPYSPDMNPIELAWSKLKSIQRTLKPRTVDELTAAIAQAIKKISTADIAAWIKHCGYIQ